MMLYMAAARCPPRSEPANSHDFLPSAIPRNARSAALLERQIRPSSRKRVNAVQRLSMYSIALATSLPRESLARCSRIQPSRSATNGALSLLTDGPALLGTLAIDGAFDLEQGVDAPDCLQGQRRDRPRGLALCLATGVLGQIRHGEERAAGMDPAGCFQDRARFVIGLV